MGSGVSLSSINSFLQKKPIEALAKDGAIVAIDFISLLKLW
jgi:hypothetical protein